MRDWTKTVRPPFEVTNAIKLAKLRERGLTATDKRRFELDHKIRLALGGAPTDPRAISNCSRGQKPRKRMWSRRALPTRCAQAA